MLLVFPIHCLSVTHPIISNVAVAAHLALYKFNLKTDPPSAFKPDLKEVIPDQFTFKPLAASKEWDAGVIAAKAQNFARTVSHPRYGPSCTRPYDFLAPVVDGTTGEHCDTHGEFEFLDVLDVHGLRPIVLGRASQNASKRRSKALKMSKSKCVMKVRT